MEKKLYVGNLAFTTTEDEIRELFAQAGVVESVTMIKDRDSGTSKGFAFVEMSNQTEAEQAISMFNGYNMAEREIKVSPARPREERGDYRSGGYGQGRGGSKGGHSQKGGRRRY
jgi:RNA recognition motif-containing protein